MKAKAMVMVEKYSASFLFVHNKVILLFQFMVPVSLLVMVYNNGILPNEPYYNSIKYQ